MGQSAPIQPLPDHSAIGKVGANRTMGFDALDDLHAGCPIDLGCERTTARCAAQALEARLDSPLPSAGIEFRIGSRT